MAEKFRYGPLVYNCFGDDDTSGNYWWSGSPVVGYAEPEGVYKIPVDEQGNQCLPGECILHPNCRIASWDSRTHPDLGKIPDLTWCRSWFEDHFLIISDWEVCRYILRWYWHNQKHDDHWKKWSAGKTTEQMIGEIWPDVPKS